MKKIAVLSLLTLLCASNCKKTSTTPSPSSSTSVKCVFVLNGGPNGTSRYFYKCSSSADEMTKIALELRDKGLDYETTVKSTCYECN